MLTHFRFTLAPSYIEHMMSIKNETEIDGMRRAYLRDGVSFVRLLLKATLTLLTFIKGEIPSMARKQTLPRIRNHRIRSCFSINGI